MDGEDGSTGKNMVSSVVNNGVMSSHIQVVSHVLKENFGEKGEPSSILRHSLANDK